MASIKEKIGYGFGDMASSMFWKVFSYFLPFFYSNVFGLRLVDAAFLVLVTRIWDAVSDPMMGIVADRTHTRWGKYRPYLLWMAVPFSLCGIMLFTTPDWGYAGKLIWAYATYILMMTVYTAINVPYGAMLGVVSDNSREKTVFSSFRMFFAYGGSFIALAAWQPLCDAFLGMGVDMQGSWRDAMVAIAAACLLLFLCCFLMTREHVKSVSTASVGSDFLSLVKNRPWWVLIGAALSFNLFNTVRGAAVAYFFADVIGPDASIVFFGATILFYAGLFLSIGEIANMGGVAVCVPLAARLGKKRTFMAVNALLTVLSVGFFFLPVNPTGYWLMLLFQIAISLLTGVISPLIWSMYADVSDYSELKYNTASTGLIFSSSSMAQKFGGAIGGAAVLWLLDVCGYVARESATSDVVMQQTPGAITCLWMLLTFIPAGVALLSLAVMVFYPLDTATVDDIVLRLKERRGTQAEEPEEDTVQEDVATDLA